MRFLFLFAAMLTPGLAAAQTSNPDTNALKIAEDAAAAKATAAAAMARAATACIPQSTIPPMDMLGGSPGTGDGCRLANSVQPRTYRTASGTTDASGTATVSWAAMPSIPKLTLQPYVASTSATVVPVCYPVSATITVAGGQIVCYETQSILGLGVAPVKKTTSGISFDVLVLPGS